LDAIVQAVVLVFLLPRPSLAEVALVAALLVALIAASRGDDL
jgi:hypothetical protein